MIAQPLLVCYAWSGTFTTVGDKHKSDLNTRSFFELIRFQTCGMRSCPEHLDKLFVFYLNSSYGR
jgi:hypothetical protein